MVKLPNTTTEKKSEFERKLSNLYDDGNDIFGDAFENSKPNTAQDIPSASTFGTADMQNPSLDENVDRQEENESDGESIFDDEDFKESAKIGGFDLLEMLKEEGKAKEKEEQFPKNPVTFTLFFSADKMNAYIRADNYIKGKDSDNRIPTNIIYGLLKESNVVYGINDAGIVEYCKGKAFFKDFQVATGTRPVRGKDGSVEYFFSTDLRYAPKERDDGSVDYKELGLIRNVNQGDVLCRITPPTEGIAGTDVLGNTVKAVEGIPAVLSSGKGVEVSADGLEYLAVNNGMVELNSGVVEIKEVYTIQGDVGPATGNIRFNGAVTVMGSVLSNYAIFANGDIIVHGYVESSMLTSTGNILINNGINGMKKGFLKADGNVTVKFAEMARIIAGADFYCDYCINCDVRAGQSIIAKGKRASLLGGDYIAGKVIDAKTIGSDLNIPMELQIIPEWQNIRNLKIKPEERLKENNEIISDQAKKIAKLKMGYDTTENEISRLSRKNKFDSPDEIKAKKSRVLVLMKQKLELKHQMDLIEEEKAKLEVMYRCEGCSVIARVIVHTSVRITIGSASFRVNGHLENKMLIEEDGIIALHTASFG